MRLSALAVIGVLLNVSAALIWFAGPPTNRSASINRGETHGIKLTLPANHLVVVTANQFEIDLASTVASLPHQVHTGLDARCDFFIRPFPRVSILNIATHGFVNEDDSDLSGLVFSLINNEGQPVDGYFRLRHLYSLHLPARLVVLRMEGQR